MKVSDERAKELRELSDSDALEYDYQDVLKDLLDDREELIIAHDQYAERIEKLERVVEVVKEWDRQHSLPDGLRESFRNALRALDEEEA